MEAGDGVGRRRTNAGTGGGDGLRGPAARTVAGAATCHVLVHRAAAGGRVRPRSGRIRRWEEEEAMVRGGFA